MGHSPSTETRVFPFVLPTDFFIDLLPDFSESVFPLCPVVSPEQMRQAIATMNESAEDAALVYAYAAMTINRTRSSWAVHEELAALMGNLILRSIKATRALESAADDLLAGTLGPWKVSVSRILTTVFLSVCVFNLGHVERSFAILREGVAMLQTVSTRHFNPKYEPGHAQWQRLYWIMYLNDRHMALLFPLRTGALAALMSGLPAVDEQIPPRIDHGFRRLVNLFLVLDDEFVAHWRAQQNPEEDIHPAVTPEWVKRKQAELDDDAAQTAAQDCERKARGLDDLSELQRIDISITRLWLRTMVWQLALSRGLLCSSPTHEGLSLHFPVISICREIHPLLMQLESITSVGYHGSGMLQKLFDITSTIAEVLNLPASSEGMQNNVSRVKELLFLVNFCLGFKAVPAEQREYLIGKLEVLKVNYPMLDFTAIVPTVEASAGASAG